MLTAPEFTANPRPHKPRPKRETCEKHLRFVRSLPCCLCRRSVNVEPHHLLRGVSRGIGRKSDDRHTIPLCDVHHHAIHADGNETRFLAGYAVDGPALAAALWSVSGDYEQAVRIIG